MPLATATEVREILGLAHADDHELFRVANSAALDTLVAARQAAAVAWLTTRASDYYTGSDPGPSSTNIDALFKMAEALVTGHFLTLPLKVRKVVGTHWAVDSEDSSRYEELIDVEFLAMAERLLEGYLVIEVTDTPQYLPVFALTTALDPDSRQVWTEELQEQLDLARGLTGVEVLP